MAGTTTNVIGSAAMEFLRGNRRRSLISAKSHGGGSAATCEDHPHPHGPYCIYVGPIESATEETLEALYSQARNAYYSGEPLIVDDMFDRVELKLKWYGSKSVVKYPRCSIRRQSTYADAEIIYFLLFDLEDLSMVFALASTWTLILAFGCSACICPTWFMLSMACLDSVSSYDSQTLGLEFFFMMKNFILTALGFVIGYPITSASVKALQGLRRNDLVALKGSCPNCGEEVFAFVRMDKANDDSPHRANCHVCECLLEFRTKVEKSASRFGRQWVYGRIYLVGRSRRRN